MSKFSEMKKKMGDLEQLQKKVDAASRKGGSREADTRYWTPTKDKDGNAVATIRFLPYSEGEELPFVRIFNHGFKSESGKWFVEACPTTIGLPCPVCEANQALWAAGKEDEARSKKRKESYHSNILVINDKANPSNNGKVFLFRYGKKIFEQINNKVVGQFGEDPVNIWDFDDGANFKLRVVKKDGFDNYDNSVFDNPSPLFDGDADKQEEIWNQQYKLQPIIAEEVFKSYDELKAELNRVEAQVGNIKHTHNDQVVSYQEEDASEIDNIPFLPEKSSASKDSIPMDDLDDLDDIKALLA